METAIMGIYWGLYKVGIMAPSMEQLYNFLCTYCRRFKAPQEKKVALHAFCAETSYLRYDFALRTFDSPTQNS